MPAARPPAPPRGPCCGPDRAMSGGQSYRTLLAATALAAIVATDNATTFAQTPTVLRGSNSGGAVSGGSSAPVVLRGTTPPPAPAGPVAATAAPCPAGYALNPSSGC